MSVLEQRQQQRTIANLQAELAAAKATVANSIPAEDITNLENKVSNLTAENKTLRESNTTLTKKINKLEQAIDKLTISQNNQAEL